VSKDQIVGLLIFIACIAIAIAYTLGLFLPQFEAIRIWVVAIPVFIGFIAILAIGAWIGWIMATTPPPKPMEEIEKQEQPKEQTSQ